MLAYCECTRAQYTISDYVHFHNLHKAQLNFLHKSASIMYQQHYSASASMHQLHGAACRQVQDNVVTPLANLSIMRLTLPATKDACPHHRFYIPM